MEKVTDNMESTVEMEKFGKYGSNGTWRVTVNMEVTVHGE
jgi:hypothetical protein